MKLSRSIIQKKSKLPSAELNGLRLELFDVLLFATSRGSGLFVVSVGYCPKRCKFLDFRRFYSDNRFMYEIKCDGFADCVHTFRDVALEIFHNYFTED